MWVLVLIVCGTTCQMDTVIGTYSKKETCEEAVEVFAGDVGVLARIERRAYCIPAPDDIVYE
jgi:predicted deacylase